MNRPTLIFLVMMWIGGITPASAFVTPEADDWQVRLELARRQRQRAEFELATRTLTSLLEQETDDARIRTVLLELTRTAEDAGQTARAIQVLGQFLERFPEDPDAPELLLRQGLLYRRLGAHAMALSKLYAVLTATLNLRLDPEGRYQRLVLVAQTEIAETHFLQGAYDEAAELFERLLRMETAALNRRDILLRLLRCYHAQGKPNKVVDIARELLSEGEPLPEAQFLLSRALYELGEREAALRTVLDLIAQPADVAWARVAGNELANQMYRAGDFSGAVAVYEALLALDESPQWRVPVLYQIGLARERLGDRAAAQQAYRVACELGRSLPPNNIPSSVQTVLDLATWRQNHLAWLQHDPTPLVIPPSSPHSP